MNRMGIRLLAMIAVAAASFLIAGDVLAQDAATSAAPAIAADPAASPAAVAALASQPEAAGQPYAGIDKNISFILNSFMFLMCGILVMWMNAGFAMLEAGLVRAKNTAAICLKNFLIYAIAGVMFYIIGYNIMYVGVGDPGLFGTFKLFYDPTASELALIGSSAVTAEQNSAVTDGAAYASMSDWFFQMVFVSTAASIVSGTVAERMKLWPFLLFVIILTGLIYPLTGAWTWGKGWLFDLGFIDFAGTTVVHSVGGWAALTGAIIVGPRLGKYGANGRVQPIPGANMPLATLGTFILWMGWFGFNGGSVLALGSAQSVSLMSLVLANTNMAACAGCLVATAYATLRYGKPDLTLVLNGALAGLVSITGAPDVASPMIAMLIGGIGGLLCSAAVPFFDRLKIDDVVGALPVHLVCGIWGTLAVGIFKTGDIIPQLIGIAAVGAFAGLTSAAIWQFLKYTIGLRVDEREERLGLDTMEVGLEAYPDFEVRST